MKKCKNGHIDPPRYKGGACAICQRDKAGKAYARNKERAIEKAIQRAKGNPEARRDQQRAVRLGVPVSQVREAIERSGYVCGACSKQLTHQTLCVDHCHKTGKIRGVLCRFCNALDGMLNKQADRVALLKIYLARAKSQL